MVAMWSRGKCKGLLAWCLAEWRKYRGKSAQQRTVLRFLSDRNASALELQVLNGWKEVWRSVRQDRVSRQLANTYNEHFRKYKARSELLAFLSVPFWAWLRAHYQDRFDQLVVDCQSQRADLEEELWNSYARMDHMAKTLQRELHTKEELAAELREAYNRIKQQSFQSSLGSPQARQRAMASGSQLRSHSWQTAPRQDTSHLAVPHSGSHAAPLGSREFVGAHGHAPSPQVHERFLGGSSVGPSPLYTDASMAMSSPQVSGGHIPWQGAETHVNVNGVALHTPVTTPRPHGAERPIRSHGSSYISHGSHVSDPGAPIFHSGRQQNVTAETVPGGAFTFPPGSAPPAARASRKGTDSAHGSSVGEAAPDGRPMNWDMAVDRLEREGLFH